jgi:pimeloyl-ACP methyl ester carboxylesterase
MPFSKINGFNLYWEMTGEKGEPLILVHGSWVDHHNWDLVVQGLARNFRVVTYDRRGHSQSERLPGQGFAYEDVNDLAAVIDHFELKPAHIVGNSFGAIITLKLAAQRPELFKTMIVHEPPLFTLLEDQPEALKALQIVGERITAVVNLLEQGKNEQGAELFVETIAFGPGAWKTLPTQLQDIFIYNAGTWLDEVKDDDSLRLELNKLKNFSAPVLLSQGETSPPFFPAVIDVIRGALPYARRNTFAGAGHVPHITHPGEYVATVRTFILENS